MAFDTILSLCFQLSLHEKDCANFSSSNDFLCCKNAGRISVFRSGEHPYTYLKKKALSVLQMFSGNDSVWFLLNLNVFLLLPIVKDDLTTAGWM